MEYRQCYRCGKVKTDKGEYEKPGYWVCDECADGMKAEVVEKTKSAEKRIAELEAKLADKEKPVKK